MSDQERALEVLRALVADHREDWETPCFGDERGHVYCFWCAGVGDGNESDHTPIRHEAECPWVRALAVTTSNRTYLA